MLTHHISFKYAFDGIVYCFRSQPNFRIHTLATILVLLTSWFLRVNHTELIVLLFTIMLVLVAEMLNTAVEAMTDLITEERHRQAKIAKDVAAGMVLMSAILAVIIGAVIFIPYIQTRIF
jgi:diacylglycerol kinase (ATP)